MSAIDTVIPKPLRGIPEPAKWAVAALEGYAAYRVGKYAWSKLNPSDQEQEVAAAQTEVERILKQNKDLPADERQLASYSPAQMQTFANTLYSAMDGGGSDETSILDVFKKMNNDLDILLLVDAFGTRTGSSWFASSTPTGLSDWLQSDGMTPLVNALLDTKAKITMRF